MVTRELSRQQVCLMRSGHDDIDREQDERCPKFIVMSETKIGLQWGLPGRGVSGIDAECPTLLIVKVDTVIV